MKIFHFQGQINFGQASPYLNLIEHIYNKASGERRSIETYRRPGHHGCTGSVWRRKRRQFIKAELKKKGKLICSYCGSWLYSKYQLKYPEKYGDFKLKYTNYVTIDHIEPKYKGGFRGLDTQNWVISCCLCNNRKGSGQITSDIIGRSRKELTFLPKRCMFEK